MKKYLITTMVFCIVLLFTSPAMALSVDFSGYLFARGFFSDRVDLQSASGTDAYLESEFRLQTVFNVSDNLKVTTRFDALAKKWGNPDSGVTNDDNIDFDRAYMTIKTPFGIFDVGRMSGEWFGTTFLDSLTERDKIKYSYTFGDTTLIAFFDKKADNDGGIATTSAQSLEDQNSYNLAAITKLPIGVIGVLLNYEDDMSDAAIDRKEYFINPYFDLKVGTIALQGELKYALGDINRDNVAQDIDVKRFAANIEGSIGFELFTVMAGFAFLSGDNDLTDGEDSRVLGGTGEDWQKLWILTGETDDSYVLLGGGYGGLTAGNLAAKNVADFPVGAAQHGAKIIYVGVSMSPWENLTVGLIFGSSKAEKAPDGNDDNHGMEWDFTLNYQLMDNLSYSFIAAFLAPGDYWKGNDPTVDIENTYALYHELKIKF